VEQKYGRQGLRRLRPPARQMHVESAYSQGLVPRRAQHLVRRQTIQSVVHPTTDQCADYTADEPADGGAYRCGYLRRFVDAPCRLYFVVGSASWGRAGGRVGPCGSSS
jgi:hypothetical protein